MPLKKFTIFLGHTALLFREGSCGEISLSVLRIHISYWKSCRVQHNLIEYSVLVQTKVRLKAWKEPSDACCLCYSAFGCTTETIKCQSSSSPLLVLQQTDLFIARILMVCLHSWYLNFKPQRMRGNAPGLLGIFRQGNQILRMIRYVFHAIVTLIMPYSDGASII